MAFVQRRYHVPAAGNARQSPVAAGVPVETPAPLRHLHGRAGALVAGVGDRAHPGGVEGVENAVLTSSANGLMFGKS
jgi:hypothetical protein